MRNPANLKRWSRRLQVSAVLLAVAGLIFRATLYWRLPPEAGRPFGTGDLVDFAFALALFLVSTACAISGVAINLVGSTEDKGMAFRAILVGLFSFIVYEFLHGLVPRLM